MPPAPRPQRRRIPAAALAVLVLTLIAASGPAATPAAARSPVSYTDELTQFMCVACHEALGVAQSPESFSERQYLRTLIAQGDSPEQIRGQMVANYGTAVLAVPPASGFNLLVYVVPPVVLVLGIVTVLITLPRWRRHGRSEPPDPAAATAVSPKDSRRLEDELAQYS